ncbi:MAG: hypothetical protein JWM98_1034 [Thermoleophilia bacterium]|nr:hypothetical protein [Thermoleophilia bacterium]
MQATVAATVAGGFDGPVDEGIEGAGGDVSGGAMRDVGAEAAAHATLRLVAEHPGEMGRLRAARLVGGYPVPHRDDEEAVELGRYAVQLDWPLREITRLVDALIAGRMVAQTKGPRPVLVLTRAGYRTLEALEAGPQRP